MASKPETPGRASGAAKANKLPYWGIAANIQNDVRFWRRVSIIEAVLLMITVWLGFVAIVLVYDKPAGYLERLSDGRVKVVQLADQVDVIPADILNQTNEFIHNLLAYDFTISDFQQADAARVMAATLQANFLASLRTSEEARQLKQLGVRASVYYDQCNCTDDLTKDAEIKETEPGTWRVKATLRRESISIAQNSAPLPNERMTVTMVWKKNPRTLTTRYGLELQTFDIQRLATAANMVDAMAPKPAQTAQPVPVAPAQVPVPVNSPAVAPASPGAQCWNVLLLLPFTSYLRGPTRAPCMPVRRRQLRPRRRPCRPITKKTSSVTAWRGMTTRVI